MPLKKVIVFRDGHHFRAAFRQRLPQSTHQKYRVNRDCVEVDELILEITDYKNDYADMAAEKLLRKCSTSWEAYCYLQDRVHDAWLPDSARQQVRQILKRIRVRMHQQREYGWAYE
jgi:hypothetical protein